MPHETGEPRNLLIMGIGIGSVVTLTAIMFGLQSYFVGMRDAEQQTKIFGRQSQELLELRAKEEKQLTSYAYLDAQKTRVRIPIDVAMKTLAQRGRDGIPALKTDPATLWINGPPAAAGSASAPPATSAAPTSSSQLPTSPPASATPNVKTPIPLPH